MDHYEKKKKKKEKGSEVKEFACLKGPNVELTHGSLKKKSL